jgi:hypothetical protein
MTKEEFINKYGQIRILEDQNKYFSRLTHPVKINGKWEKGNGKGTPLFNGNFYNIGFFPKSADPAGIEHNWDILDYQISFISRVIDLLKNNKCFALQSEGDGIFFPFIWSGKLEENDLPDDNALGVLASKEINTAYKCNEITSNYSNMPIFYDLNEQKNIFWDDDFEEDITDDLDPVTKNAFVEASSIMKEELKIISEIQYYPDYIEFPVIIGGKDKFGHFIGIMTSLVWT